jgi:hypothetical protein
MPVIVAVGTALTLCLAAGVFLYRNPRLPADFDQRYMIAALPFGYALLGSILLAMLGRMPFWDWNAARLAPTIALWHGYNPYPGEGSGPINGNLYGPVSTIIYLPAVLGPDPTTAILIAGAVSLLLMIVPVGLLHLMAGGSNAGADPKDTYQKIVTSCGVLFAVSLLLIFPGIEYALGSIHADSPSMGLGLSACLVMMHAARRPNWTGLIGCATLASLAYYAKQIEAPLTIALVLYLGVVQSWSWALRFLVCLFVVGLLLGTAFAFAFGLPDLYFNTIRVPSSHPWKGPAATELSNAAFVITLSGSVLIFIILRYCLAAVRETSKSALEIRAWLADRGWPLLLLAGVVMIPTSLLGEVKVGGGINSNHCLYYFAACASLMIFGWAARIEPVTRKTALLAYYFLLALVLGISAKEIVDLQWYTMLSKNPQQEAYRFAQRHPGEAYFPWHPLATLMAEGKLYHFEYGVFDRYLADLPPAHLRKFIPRTARYLIFQRRNQSRDMAKHLPEFSRGYMVADLDELPLSPEAVRSHQSFPAGAPLGGWYVFEKERSNQ